MSQLLTNASTYSLNQSAWKSLKRNQPVAAKVRRRKKGNLAFAKCMHAHLWDAATEIEAHTTAANFIVPMLVECGSMSDAQQAFDKLAYPNEYSWTALIFGYVKFGQPEHAFSLYGKMQLDSVGPSSHTLIALLQACRKLKDVERGQQFHVEISKHGYAKDLLVGNTLIDMYAKCGSLVEAQNVFDKLPCRDVVSWNALIAGYVDNGSAGEALTCFKLMQLQEVSPNRVTFICSLKACGKVGAVDEGRKLHTEIVKKGLDKDVFVGCTLVDMYVKCGLLAEARKVFNKLSKPDVVSWTSLIAGYAEHGHGQEALKCYDRMKQEGISPNAATLVSCLKACSNLKAIDKGRQIHTEITRMGYERDISVNNSLIDMYAKCGLLDEAQSIFDKLTVRDTVTWTALVAGYVDHGLGEEAFRALEQMQLEGVPWNVVTCICSLKACSSLGLIDKGRQIHLKIAQNFLEEDIAIGNTLIAMYAKCGFFTEAQEVFKKLTFRNVVSWTSLIEGYTQHERGSEALKCFEQMQLEGIFPNSITFICTLKACGIMGAIGKGREIHAAIVQRELEGDSFVGNTLVGMYARCASLAEAQRVFEILPLRDIVSWNVLMVEFVENELYEEVINFFEQIQEEGMLPDALTYTCLLKACGYLGNIQKLQEVHIQIMEKGLERNLTVSNTLVDMYAKCGYLAEAQNVFDNLPVRDAVSWTALIARCAENGLGQKALFYFKQMQLDGVSPDVATYICCLKACSSMGDIEKGREIHMELSKKGFGNDIFICNTLIDMYIKCGSPKEAWEVFYRLPIQDLVSWNAILGGCAENELGGEVLKWFELMQLQGISPDKITFISVLKACSSIGAIDEGRKVHSEITHRGLERDAFISSALVDMYAKCGSLTEARNVFDKLLIRGVGLWNALIRGYGLNGKVTMAIQCFEDMQKCLVKPDATSFACILAACSRGEKLHEGQGYFESMIEEHQIIPLSVHYNCLLDLFARSGQLYQAETLLKYVPGQPSIEAWTTMLGACKTYGELELGLRCFQKLVQMIPKNAIPYALMANVYAS